jgi:pentatricopeptide repeat protein
LERLTWTLGWRPSYCSVGGSPKERLNPLRFHFYFSVSNGGYKDVSLFLNCKIIYQLVLNWNQVFKQSANFAEEGNSPQELVHQLDKLCDKSPSLKIRGIMLSLILDATLHLCIQVASSLEVAEFCEVLWNRLVEAYYKSSYNYRPDVISFNSVLSAWKCFRRPDRAQAFLDRAPLDVVTPDTRSYNIVLSAYATGRDGPAAERLLKRMCRQWQLQHIEGEKPNADRGFGRDQSSEISSPNEVTWTTVICAWTRSYSPHAARRAQALLTRMNDPSNAPVIRPSLLMFNKVLLCMS